MKSALVCLPIVMFLTACSSLPASSVKLSAEVGKGIDAQFEAQRKLVDLYFAEKQRDLDESMLAALNDYFDTIAPNGAVSLTRDELNDVAVDVETLNRKNNAAKRALDEERVALLSQLGRQGRGLVLANASITGLLRSSVSLRQAQSEALAELDDLSGNTLNVETVVEKVDRIAKDASTGSAEAEKIIEGFGKLRQKGTREEETGQ